MIPDTQEIEHIRGLKRGDREIMRQVYEKFQRKIFGICLRYSSNREEASDYVHDGFLKVFTEFSRFKEGSPLEGWIATVIRNNTIDLVKKKNRIRASSFDGEALENIGEDISQEEYTSWMENVTPAEVLECMNDLPNRMRTMLNMYAIDGMSHKEIASILEVTVGTSKSQISRAREKLIYAIKQRIKSRIPKL